LTTPEWAHEPIKLLPAAIITTAATRSRDSAFVLDMGYFLAISVIQRGQLSPILVDTTQVASDGA
jgi:hypothetical protein